MGNNILYSDKLIEIRNDSIMFRKYYITFTNKTVRFDDIEKIVIEKPSLLTGKYRYWGTGDFRHWFPLDLKRSSRKLIFILYKKNKKVRIGLSVEDEDKVVGILKEKVQLINNSSLPLVKPELTKNVSE